MTQSPVTQAVLQVVVTSDVMAAIFSYDPVRGTVPFQEGHGLSLVEVRVRRIEWCGRTWEETDGVFEDNGLRRTFILSTYYGLTPFARALEEVRE